MPTYIVQYHIAEPGDTENIGCSADVEEMEVEAADEDKAIDKVFEAHGGIELDFHEIEEVEE